MRLLHKPATFPSVPLVNGNPCVEASFFLSYFVSQLMLQTLPGLKHREGGRGRETYFTVALVDPGRCLTMPLCPVGACLDFICVTAPCLRLAGSWQALWSYPSLAQIRRQSAFLRLALLESHWPSQRSSWIEIKTALSLVSLSLGPHQVHRSTHPFFTLISSGSGDRLQNNYFFAAKAAGCFLLPSRFPGQMSTSPLCLSFSQ